MNCPNCGTAVPENQSHCPDCGEELLTPEQRARRKWEQREQERKQKKRVNAAGTAGKLERIENPKAELVQSLVAELDGMERAHPAEAPEEATDRARQEDESELPDGDALEETTQEAAEQQEALPEAESDTAPEPDEKTSETGEEKTVEPEPEEKPGEQSPEKSVLERQHGTVHINVEEALASLPKEEQDDIPDIRIPEIYARARYVPTNSRKWAQRAAKDVENDWEGFDPDNEDWTEEEERSHPVLVLVVGILLLVSVLLAAHAYVTSDLTGGIGLTVGSM